MRCARTMPNKSVIESIVRRGPLSPLPQLATLHSVLRPGVAPGGAVPNVTHISQRRFPGDPPSLSFPTGNRLAPGMTGRTLAGEPGLLGVGGHQATSACKGMTRARQPQKKSPLGVGAERHSRARVSQMTAQKLMTLAQRHIHSLTAIIDHLNKIGAQDELRTISLHLRRLASLIDDARRILL
jgi:hypothetical protein